jgi:exopolysaccharide biosynthesis polyprenyl glycosylphosphotransferase
MKSMHKKILLLLDFSIVVSTIIIFSSVYSIMYNFSIDLKLPDSFSYITLFLLIVISFYINHLYRYNIILNIIPHSFAIIKSMILSFILLIFIAFVMKAEKILINRHYWIALFLYILITFLFIRVLLVPLIYKWLIKKKMIKRNALILGGGKFGTKLVKLLQNSNNYFNIIGIIDDDSKKKSYSFNGVPVVGNLEELEQIVIGSKVSDIFIAINKISHDQLAEIVEKCKNLKKRVHVASTHYNNVIDRCEIEEIGGSTFFRIAQSNPGSYYRFFKRTFDIVLSSFLVLVLSPFFLIISLIIITSSRGPALYKAVVVGKHGKTFTWIKFRSMVLNDESEHVELVKKVINSGKKAEKLKGDSRITVIGRFMRKFGIDELPQLINVLKGEMSLVGPRPKLQYEYELMKNWQKARFSVIPGITGLYQIKGKNDVAFKDEIVIDLYYIENRTIKLDLEIAVKTIPFLIFGNNR